jgi:hypothetical protein
MAKFAHPLEKVKLVGICPMARCSMLENEVSSKGSENGVSPIFESGEL